MRLFSSIIMLVLGVLLLASSFTEVNAFAVRRNGAKREVETSMAGQEETTVVVNRTQTTSRGKVKFHMKTPVGDAEGLVRRPRINRVRSTTMRSNAVFRDSLETDVSLEDLKIVSHNPTTAKTIWWTTTTPRPILAESSEKDDIELGNAPVLIKAVVNRNPFGANRLNRFRTTTVPTAVTKDSLEQEDDQTFVMSPKPAVPQLEKTSFSVGSRFSNIRPTTARNLVSKDSVETNDVPLEDLVAVPKPVVNRALTAPRSRGRFQMKTSLDSISPSTSTLAPTTPVDSTEKTDILLEDLERTTVVVPATTLTVTELETATTAEIVTTTMPTVLVSLQADEQGDVFITDRTTVTPEPTSDLVDTTVTILQLTTQSDDQMDFDRVDKLVVALDRAQLTDQLSNAAVTTLISPQSDEKDDWTVSMPTSTMAPAVTQSSPVPRGRGRFQSATPANQVSRNRVNRTRLNPTKSSMTKVSDEQEAGLVKETQTTTTSRAPASGNRFSRVRTTTARPPVFKDSVEQKDVSLEDLIVLTVPTTRKPVMGSRLNRFRTTTTASPVAVTVGQEAVASKSEIPKNKNRFSRVRSTTARVPVSVDSVEKDSLIVVNDLSKVKAAKVSVQPTASSEKVMPIGNPSVNRGRGGRGRKITTATPISRHSMEDFSLEDALKQLEKTGEKLSVQQPAITPEIVNVAIPLSEISKHSDEHDDVVVVPVTPTTAVTLVVGVTDVDISDESPTTISFDPVSRESGEKEGLALVLVDEAVVPVTTTDITLQMVELSDIRVEAPRAETLNPISKESEELPLTKITKRVKLIRKPNSQI